MLSRTSIKEKPFLDEKKDMLVPMEGKKRGLRALVFKKIPKENLFVKQIVQIGRNQGLTLEVLYSPDLEKFIIFATNFKGFRWIFFTVEEPGGAFRPLDGRAVQHTKQILYHSRSKKARKDFFLGLGKAREEAKKKRDEDSLDMLTYMGGEYRRTFQALGRITGVNPGKVKRPYITAGMDL